MTPVRLIKMDSLVNKPQEIDNDSPFEMCAEPEVYEDRSPNQEPVYFDTHSSNTQFRVSATTPISCFGISRNEYVTPSNSDVKVRVPY